MKKPKIAVGCISYNHAKYLANYFYSLSIQEVDLTLFIRDDCSTDGSDRIIKNLASGHLSDFITYYKINDKNLGPWGNFIACLEDVREHHITLAAQGSGYDYVAWVEGDDYLLPGSLKKKLDFLQSNPDYSMVHTDVSMLNEDGSKINKFWYSLRFFPPSGNIRKSLENGNFIYTCSFLCKYEDYMRYFDYEKFLKLKLGFGDLPFMLQLSKDKKIGYIDEALSVYRNISTSVSHENRPNMIRWTQEILAFAKAGVI